MSLCVVIKNPTINRLHPDNQLGIGGRVRAAPSARSGSKSIPAVARQPSAAGHAASVPTNSANGRDRTPSNCSHATSPPSGSAMSYGRKYGRPCSKLALSFRRRHQSRSDAVRLCALSRSDDTGLGVVAGSTPAPTTILAFGASASLFSQYRDQDTASTF